MKILFLNLYSGKVERGAESFTHELARRLGEENEVSFLKGNSELLPENRFAGSLINRLSKRFFLDKQGREVLTFSLGQIGQIRRIRPNVVIPLNGFWQLLILKFLQPFLNFKIIVIGNSGPGWDERWNLYLHPNCFVATTPQVLDWAKKTWSFTKSILIPYGIDPKKFEVKPAIVNLPKPIILCPAALVPYKRVDLVIKAVAKLPNSSLLVLGKGPLKEELLALGAKHLANRFLLTSSSQEDIPKFYAAADVVTLPSHAQENSPMVFLEALAAGKMVVTTDSPRNRWMLGDDGIFTNPENTNEYADSLAQALKRKIPTDSKNLQKFSWDTVLKQYFESMILPTNN
jgi:glycosyltransferase involved in cell wall biosynthesis